MRKQPKARKVRAAKPANRFTYSGERLRCVAMPLGGIGTGQVSICGDGSLRQWQIFNEVNHQAFVPHSFFCIWARPDRGRASARVLQSGALYGEKGFQPVPCVTDHVVPDQAKALLERLPGVEQVEFVGKYPVGELRYSDDAFPAQVTLETFSPMAPLDAKESGLPAAIFNFKVRNPGKVPVWVSIGATIQNAVGYRGAKPIRGLECEDYGGNSNQAVRLQGLTGILMTNAWLATDAPGFGNMTLGVLTGGEETQSETSRATAFSHWDNLEEFWQDFAVDGQLGQEAPSPPSRPKRTWNGALALLRRIEPGEEVHFTFLLTWHFPNFYVPHDQRGFGIKDTKSKFWLGTMYCNWFGSSLATAEYIRDKFARLRGMTLEYRDAFFASNLPEEVLDAVSSQSSIIRSPTVFRIEDGSVFGWEGCRGGSTDWASVGGCCPMNCTHVWNYEQSLAFVFPELERNMRSTDLFVQMNADGGIPHRTVVPLYLPRWDEPESDSSCYACDGHWGTVLKTYREVRQCQDSKFLVEAWPRVRKAMEYGTKRWDGDEDGVLDGPQWNTYDLNFYGYTTFTTSLYLAALRAAEEMARLQGEAKCADEYRRRFEKGHKKVDKELWNGEYYVQKYDARKHLRHQYGKGCLSDQLIGQWWAEVVGLGHILEPTHVRTALKSIYHYNLRRDFTKFRHTQRVFACGKETGLLVCTWPHGGRPAKPMLYCDEVWTGIEYQVASHMLYEGMIKEALEIVRGARDRYDGRVRNPFNEVECGDHYARAMSSWALLLAAQGYAHDGPAGILEFAPRIAPQDHCSLFTTGSAWGLFSQRKRPGLLEASLAVKGGEQTLKELRLATSPKARGVAVRLNGRTVKATLRCEGNRAGVLFAKPVRIKAGQTLSVRLK